MKKLEEIARKLLRAGGPVGSALDVTASTFYRAEAEVCVTQAKGK